MVDVRILATTRGAVGRKVLAEREECQNSRDANDHVDDPGQHVGFTELACCGDSCDQVESEQPDQTPINGADGR